ncbi:divalent-cation tolerance protein CutA [Ktedonosporobacter rubrisoli]|uniref:Divalent-cation tolerance protein CutA n=1 Tax=Ktedonosporobacter rubrisoli TaxID=2509675 RepID=A0A4P6JZ50_KTERU|nr:divalent-cation tolerance protein CutA [Ktedonosporobacter rubrisoli]QBD81148.1 divalent-cation tolerance protein CutA [Ktedonosporobacter rubrisoli]
MQEFIQIITALSSEELVRKITDTLIDKRLAASVWISGPMTSTYRWQGKIESTTDWVCTINTRRELYNAVEQAIKELYPSDDLGILALPVLTGNKSYLEWITQETQNATDRSSE